MINECSNNNNLPCAPINEGGFCIDTHPNNPNYSMYECGYKSDFIAADKNYRIDGNHCEKYCWKNVTDKDICNERIFLTILLLLSLTRNPDVAIVEEIKMEKTVKIAYKRSFSSTTSSCQICNLDNVIFFKILKDHGQ